MFTWVVQLVLGEIFLVDLLVFGVDIFCPQILVSDANFVVLVLLLVAVAVEPQCPS